MVEIHKLGLIDKNDLILYKICLYKDGSPISTDSSFGITINFGKLVNSILNDCQKTSDLVDILSNNNDTIGLKRAIKFSFQKLTTFGKNDIIYFVDSCINRSNSFSILNKGTIDLIALMKGSFLTNLYNKEKYFLIYPPISNIRIPEISCCNSSPKLKSNLGIGFNEMFGVSRFFTWRFSLPSVFISYWVHSNENFKLPYKGIFYDSNISIGLGFINPRIEIGIPSKITGIERKTYSFLYEGYYRRNIFDIEKKYLFVNGLGIQCSLFNTENKIYRKAFSLTGGSEYGMISSTINNKYGNKTNYTFIKMCGTFTTSCRFIKNDILTLELSGVFLLNNIKKSYASIRLTKYFLYQNIIE